MTESETEHDFVSLSEDFDCDNAYYGFLNVPRCASTSEVSAAYKRLARLYHPDKHQDATKRAQAEEMFAKLKKAYEVLSDPHKRAVYDCLGEKGLEEQGWQVVQRTKTPQEIRDEYKALAKAREERRLQQRTNPTSRFQMTVNATDLFDRYLYDEEYDDLIESSLPHLEVSGLSFHQSIDAPLTAEDTATLSGNVNTSNGTGGGSVALRVRRLAGSGGWQEGELGVGQGANLGGKVYRKLGARSFVNMSGTIQFARQGLRPEINLSLGRYLDQRTVGYLTYINSLGVKEDEEEISLYSQQSAMSSMVVRSSERYHATASLQLGIPQTYVMLSYTRKLLNNKFKLRAALKAGTFGAMLEYGVEEKISDQSNLSATMVVGFPMGVTCRIKVTRSSQTYLFPIHLSDELLPQPIFYGTIAPVLLWLAVKKIVIEPYRARLKAEEREKAWEVNKEKVAENKRQAEANTSLMEERYNRILGEEEARERGGLVLVRVLYGQLTDDSGDLVACLQEWPAETKPVTSNPPWVDVTKAFQCCVEDSRLVLWEGVKSSLPGVWDPCPDEDKWILINYVYQNVRHQLLCPEVEAVKLPKTSHRISSS